MPENDLFDRIRTSQDSVLESLEEIKKSADVEILPSLEEIRTKQLEILQSIEEVQDEIRLP